MSKVAINNKTRMAAIDFLVELVNEWAYKDDTTPENMVTMMRLRDTLDELERAEEGDQ